MKGKNMYKSLFAAGFSAAVLIFRICPGIAAFWTNTVIRPFGQTLNHLTGFVPFPVSELLILLVLFTLITGFLCAVLKSFRRKGFSPIMRWIKSSFGLLLFFLAAYAFLWYPAYWTVNAEAPSPDSDQIIWLCETLIDELNHADFDFPSAEKILQDAAEISGIPNARVKAARYPEWMHIAHISGLYIPFTGEAIINPHTPAAALPFTAVHELMHLKCIADEGAANNAAWEACRNAGGPFFVSAKLWVLKYALEMLDNGPSAAETLYSRMNPGLYEAFCSMNGPAPSKGRGADFFLSALGLSRKVSSYPEVVARILDNA